MNLLRNFLAVPLAALLGIYTPFLYMKLILFIESFLCSLNRIFPFIYECSVDGGYILFIIPEIYFWIYIQTIVAGALGGLTTIYLALKITKDENNLLYISLFLTSLIITSLNVYGDIQKELVVAVARVLGDLAMFGVAGLYPLYMAINNKKLSDEMDMND